MSLRSILSSLFMLPMVANGEPLAVDGDILANAFSFEHNGGCYALHPDHIVGRGAFPVIAGDPPRTGTVDSILHMRFPALDLAIGEVTGDAAINCFPRMSPLGADDTALLSNGSAGYIARRLRSGRLVREPVQIQSVDYGHLTYLPIDPEARRNLGQGWSGGVVYVNQMPVAIQLDREPGPDGLIKALRLDAALAWYERFLVGAKGSLPFEGTTTSEFDAAFSVTSWSKNPILTATDARSLTSLETVPYVVGSTPLVVDLTLVGTSDDVSAIRIDTVPEDETTSPRVVDVHLQRRIGGEFKFATSGSGGQDGKVDIAISGQKFVALRLVFSDTWDSSLPLRLDQIRIIRTEN